MIIISKNIEGIEKVYENIESAVVVTKTGERLSFTSLKIDLIHINEEDVQLFTLTREKSE